MMPSSRSSVSTTGKPETRYSPAPLVELLERRVRADGDRVGDDPGLGPLHQVDLVGLVLDREVAVQHAEAALAGHRDRHPRLGDGVHRGADQRHLERDLAGQPGRRVDVGGREVGVTRQQQDVVVGQAQGGELLGELHPSHSMAGRRVGAHAGRGEQTRERSVAPGDAWSRDRRAVPLDPRRDSPVPLSIDPGRTPGRRLVDSRWTIAVAAAAAFVLRLPGLTRPIRADEAGFALVGAGVGPAAGQPLRRRTSWTVRRLLIALFKVSDALAGPLFIRVIGALACAALVVTAAAVARLVADERAARWTAVAMAAFTTNILIDAVAVKGELLALPLLMGSLWFSLVAVAERSPRAALGAGLLAGLALGFKQNLVGGLVFATVLFVGSWRPGGSPGRGAPALPALLAGAAVPVLATGGWAVAAGVRLPTLWYAVYGFRADAAEVLAGDSARGADHPRGAAAPDRVRRRDGAGDRRLRRAHPRGVGRRPAAHLRHRRPAGGRPVRPGPRRQLLARLPVPAAARAPPSAPRCSRDGRARAAWRCGR